MMATGGAASRLIGSAVRAQRLDQHVIDDLDDHLAGRDRFDDIGADRAGPHLVGERAHDVERHVGFEQGATNFAQRFGDVGLRKGAAPRELVENAGELVGKALEHGCSPWPRCGRNAGLLKAKSARERDAPPDVGLPTLGAARFRSGISDEICAEI